MKYHIIPAPKKLTESEIKNIPLRYAFNELNNELVKTIGKFSKKEHGLHCKELFHLYDEECMKKLIGRLNDGDELIIHGEGQPFVIGLNEPSAYDLSPYILAKLLKSYEMPDLAININLLACYSATQYQELNFEVVLCTSFYFLPRSSLILTFANN